jgi:hypothetical protein
MAKAKTAEQLFAIQKARFGRVAKSMVDNHFRMALLAREDLEELTEGSISKQTLRRLGHPFGRMAAPAGSVYGGARRGVRPGANRKMGRHLRRGSVPLRPINVQSGRLRSAIFLRTVAANTYELGSGVPHASFIFSPMGTRRMVGRGIMTGHALGRRSPWGELEKRHRTRRRIIREAFQKSNRSNN